MVAILSWGRLVNTLRPSEAYASMPWDIISAGNALVPEQFQAINWTITDLI